MCLERVDEVTKIRRTAYKVVEKRDGQYRSTYSFMGTWERSEYGAKPLPVGEWLDESEYRAPSKLAYHLGYPYGWHCYNSLKAATEMQGYVGRNVMVKVMLDDCIASGKQWGYRCTVARKIKILEEIDVPKQS